MDLETFLTVTDFAGTRGGSESAVVIPGAPTTLVAAGDADSIVLTWTRVGTYDNVLIDRKTTGAYTQLASIPTAATYDDTTAVAGTVYTYRVRGQRNGYASPYSNESSSEIVSAGLSADFAGTAGKFLVKTAADLPGFGGSDWTMTLWMRPTFLDNVGENRGVFGKGSFDAAATGAFELLCDSIFDRIQFFGSDGVTSTGVVKSGLVTNTWYFVTITYSRNSPATTLSLAVNRGTPTVNSSFPQLQDLTADFRIGNAIQTGIDPFQGQIAMFGIWERVLTGGELDSLYNAGAGKLYANLTSGEKVDNDSYYDMGETSNGSASVTRVDQGSIGQNMADANKVPSSTIFP